MVRVGGDGPSHLDGVQRMLLDAMIEHMQRMMRQNNEKLYGRIEGIENQLNHDIGGEMR